MSRGVVSLAGAALLAVSAPAYAQVDLSGQWAALNMNDARTRGPGPDLMDQTTIPLNDEGKAVAASYSYSTISMPDRMCMDWSQDYITFAPHAIMIERVDDPVNGGLAAVRISAGGSDRATMPIWLDGRAHPSENDIHTFNGFTTPVSSPFTSFSRVIERVGSALSSANFRLPENGSWPNSSISSSDSGPSCTVAPWEKSSVAMDFRPVVRVDPTRTRSSVFSFRR